MTYGLYSMYPNYNHVPTHPSGYPNYPTGTPAHLLHHPINLPYVTHHLSVPPHVIHHSNNQLHPLIPPVHRNGILPRPQASFSRGNYSPAPEGYPAGPRLTLGQGCHPGGAEFGFPTGLAPQWIENERNMYGFHVTNHDNVQDDGITPEVQQWFNTIDRDRSGRINAKELQAALFNGPGKHFAEGVCHLMINIFNRNRNGTIDVTEFQELLNYINNWMSVFRIYDKDDTGFIEEAELSLAVQQMGFRFSMEFFKVVVAKSDTLNHKQISSDQFIAFCVQLQRFTDIFRMKDKEQKGMIYIGFEDFLKVILSCSP